VIRYRELRPGDSFNPSGRPGAGRVVLSVSRPYQSGFVEVVEIVCTDGYAAEIVGAWAARPQPGRPTCPEWAEGEAIPVDLIGWPT
jgi:hypothetical protein